MQLAEFGVQIGEGGFEHLAMARIGSQGELPANIFARKLKSLTPAFEDRLLGSKPGFRLRRTCRGFVLLLLDGLALPSPGHG